MKPTAAALAAGLNRFVVVHVLHDVLLLLFLRPTVVTEEHYDHYLQRFLFAAAHDCVAGFLQLGLGLSHLFAGRHFVVPVVLLAPSL